MAENVVVLSVQCGPLEGGGTYSSVWVQPLLFSDREAPHLTKGPVPYKIDCDYKLAESLMVNKFPANCSIETGTRVGSGNKAKAHLYECSVTKPVTSNK